MNADAKTLSVEHDFLRLLIATYAHPAFGATKYSFDECEAIRERTAANDLDRRFASDRTVVLQRLLASSARPVEPGGVPLSTLTQAMRVLDLPESSPTSDADVRLLQALGAGLPPTLTKPSRDAARPYQPPSARAALVASILDQLIEAGLAPRFNDYDHLDDIVPIVKSRYAGPVDKHPDRSLAILRTLAILCTDADVAPALLPAALRSLLGPDHPYVPLRSPTAPPQIRATLGGLLDELNTIKAEADPDRFLTINREYSLRQRSARQRTSNSNPWGLSILGGFEENHHMLLRTLVRLRSRDAITDNDCALVVGSRYADELDFFRTHLAMPKTIGLDLCDDPEGGIIGGDMHAMPFEDNRFRFLYCAGTLCYSYNMRKAIAEFARVVTRPGYIFISDAADRVGGADPLGRSDAVTLQGMVALFYEHRYRILGQDPGRSCMPSASRLWPCLAIELLP